MPKSLQQFENWTIQAYAQWTDPFSPLDGTISGQAKLIAFPTSHLHFGTIYGDPHYLELDLVYNHETGCFIYIVQLLIVGVVLGTAIQVWADPNPTIPFKTDLFHFEDPQKTRRVESKLFS